MKFSLLKRHRQCESRQERLHLGRATFGRTVTGAGMVFAMNGYPGAGLRVRGLLRYGSKVIGSAGQAGGSGLLGTGSKEGARSIQLTFVATLSI